MVVGYIPVNLRVAKIVNFMYQMHKTNQRVLTSSPDLFFSVYQAQIEDQWLGWRKRASFVFYNDKGTCS